MALEDQIASRAKEIHTDGYPMSIGEVLSLYNDGDMDIRRPSDSRARIPKLTMVDTKSNLRFKVLCEILTQIGFSAEDFNTKDKLIDVSLCDRRNSIAHGREDYPPPGDFAMLLNEVFEMMERVGDMIMAGARMRSYRRSEPVAHTAGL